VLVQMVTQVVESPKSVDLGKLAEVDRLKIVAIAAIYYTGQEKQFDDFVRGIYPPKWGGFTDPDKMNKNYEPQVYDQSLRKQVDKVDYAAMVKQVTSIRVISTAAEAWTRRIRVLAKLHEDLHERYSQQSLDDEIRTWSRFITGSVGKIPVILIDGMDENGHFFNRGSGDLSDPKSLEIIYNTAMSARLQKFTFDGSILLAYFLPDLPGVQKPQVHDHKITYETLNWSSSNTSGYISEALLNYAEFQLYHYYNRHATSERSCRIPRPTYREIVPVWCAECRPLRHPRDLHGFMTKLLPILATQASSAKIPFVATAKQIQLALDKADNTNIVQ